MDVKTQHSTTPTVRHWWRFEPANREEAKAKVDAAVNDLPECSWGWIQLVNRVDGGYFGLASCDGSDKANIAAAMKQKIEAMPDEDLAKLNGFTGVVIAN